MKKIENGNLLKDKDKISKTQNSELESVLSSHRTIIKVIGAGGAGNNTLTRMSEVGVKGIDTIAINTDAQDLLYTTAAHKLLIGRDITHGLGAGSSPNIGEDSALESQEEIKALLEGSDMVFVTCGLGGGTGTGSAPIIADVAKSVGALTIAIVTLPFTEEGILKWDNATQGLEKLRKSADTVIVVQNDRLLDIVPDLPLNAAFKIADEILVNAVKGITELVTEKGLVNLDFADVKSIMKDGDTAMIGIGESNSENKATDAVEKAVMNPLLDVNITGAKCALINISGDQNMSIREARSVMTAVAEKLDPQAKIIWGARIDEQLQGTIRVLLIATGIKTSDKFNKKIKTKTQKLKTSTKDNEKIFDINESKSIQIKTPTFESEGKSNKKAKKVFTEIFEEEIRGDLNILKETVKNLDSKHKDIKSLRNILNACTSFQGSAQLFNNEKIEEFAIFVADVIEVILSGEIELSEQIVLLFKKIPNIVEGLVTNEKIALTEAKEFIQKVTEIIDNSNSNKKKSHNVNKNIISDDLVVDQEDLKGKLRMELN